MCADGDAVQAAVVFCAHVVLALGNGTVNVVIFLHFHGENPHFYKDCSTGEREQFVRKVGDYTGEEEKVWSRWVVRIEPQATKKFFGAAVFQKCCRGVGEQPTFAKQIILQQVPPAAIALF